MTHINTTPLSSSEIHYQKFNPNPMQTIPDHPSHRHRVNWHEAAACAIEIELRDYAGLLQFLSEYVLGKNSYRIDLLVVKKLSERPGP